MSINRKTRNIALPEVQDKFVEDLINSGQFQSASEVVRAGLRLLNQSIERHQAELDELRYRVRTSQQAESQEQYVTGTPKEVISDVFNEVINTKDV